MKPFIENNKLPNCPPQFVRDGVVRIEKRSRKTLPHAAAIVRGSSPFISTAAATAWYGGFDLSPAWLPASPASVNSSKLHGSVCGSYRGVGVVAAVARACV